MATLTITVPEGYENPAYIVLVTKELWGEHAATVIEERPEGWTEIEELGIDKSLNRLLTDAARVIRTGTAVLPKKEV